nr:MAG TPA: hypothetical protein [Caudoviricetes sp.]
MKGTTLDHRRHIEVHLNACMLRFGIGPSALD